MALFPKKRCPVCGAPLSALGGYAIKDGKICEKCWSLCSSFVNLPDLSSSDVSKHIANRCDQPEWVDATDTVDKFIAVDRKRKLWYSPSGCVDGDEDIFRFAQLIDFELIENGGSVSKGGLGSAVAGGVLFGATGAIVGSNIGKKQNDVCRQLSIMVMIDDPYISHFSIDFIIGEWRKDSSVYKQASTDAYKVMALLTMIKKENECVTQQSTIPMSSPADEILKFKNLFDMGVITQEEFDAKKKQLLGI